MLLYSVESCDYAPSLLSFGGGGGGGILTFLCDDYYRPSNATWACDPCTFSSCLMGKSREKHMTQIASLLAVSTVFICILHFVVKGGRLIRETKPPMQEIELNVQWGEGRNYGILQYIIGRSLSPFKNFSTV